MSGESPASQLFQEELQELLAELDAALLDLPVDGAAPEPVHRVFRALHSIKGACDMFGLARAVAELHQMESAWDGVRLGLCAVTPELKDLTFLLKDRLGPLAETGRDMEQDQDFTLAVRRLAPQGDGPRWIPPAPDGRGETRVYAVAFAPSDPDHFRTQRPESLLEELRQLGTAEVDCDISRVPSLQNLNPADCHLRWDVRLTTDQGLDAVRDVFLFLDHPGDVQVRDLGLPAGDEAPVRPRASDQAPDQAPPRAPGEDPEWPPAPEGASLPTRQPIPFAASPAAPQAQAASGHAGPAPADTGQPLAAPSKAPPPPTKPAQPSQSLRVDAAKLDNLVNLVGELVIAQARLSRVAQAQGAPELTSVSEEIERLVGELRDNTLGIRMLPIGTTFSRFRRLVRDLSAELGKEIDLVAEGGETELDKTVIEQLGDPLVHLLRNAIDHGVEPPEERLALGKPARGAITLSARQAGGAVYIRIRDDGRGLDTRRILAKAVERCILPADASPSDQEIFQLVFAPGFSTAEKVTSVSGRGVGMDVVKRSIKSLRGSVEIDSAPGRGATVTITLPLTLAIIDGLQVRAQDEHYIIPLTLVEECVELRAGATGQTGRAIHLRGEIVPFVRLRETFRLPGAPPALEQIVVTRHEHGRTGIAVDEVVGQQQAVIKNLGRYLGNVEGISGATIKGDGAIALILDVARLVQGVERDTASRWE